MEESPSKRPRFLHGCEVCGRSYTEKKSLNRHLLESPRCKNPGGATSRFECSQCSQPFARKENCRRHEKEVHQGIPRNAEAGDYARDEETFPDVDAGEAAAQSQKQSDDFHDENAVSDQVGSSSSREQHTVCENPNSGQGATDICSVKQEPQIASTNENDSEDDQPSNPERTSSIGTYNTPSMRTSTSMVSTTNSRRSSSGLPFSTREMATIIGADSLLRHRSRFTLPPCPICKENFRKPSRLKAHLDRHFRKIESEHRCDICDVGFAHEKDLEMHLRCAEKGHCGFHFEHAEPCLGHHMPETFPRRLSDSERFRLSFIVQSWGQVQLHAFCLALEEAMCREMDILNHRKFCWSFGALALRAMDSFDTLASRKTTRSNPEHADSRAQKEVNVTQRLAQTKRTPALKRILRSSHDAPRPVDRWLMVAIREKNMALVERLIAKGADVNCRAHRPDRLDRWAPCSPVVAAVCSNVPEMVDLLVAKGASVNWHPSGDSRRILGNWPVAWATKSGDMNMVRCLLRHGADAAGPVSAQSRLQETLDSFAQYDEDTFLRYMELLVEYNTGARRAEWLGFAIARGWHASLGFLLRSCAFDHKDLGTLLELTLEFADATVILLLIDHGADIECESPSGRTPMEEAIHRCDLDLQKALLTRGAESEFGLLPPSRMSIDLKVYNDPEYKSTGINHLSLANRGTRHAETMSLNSTLHGVDDYEKTALVLSDLDVSRQQHVF